MILNRLHITLSFLLLSFFTFSQSNTLVVFSEDPTPFFVVLDGVKKNQTAETRVTIPGIQQTNSSVKIFFENENLVPVSKTIWWDEEHRNDEVTFRLVPTKKGYKLRFFSTKLRAPEPVSNNTPPPTPSNATQTIPQQNVQSTTTTTVTETTSVNTTNDTDIEDGSVNMNINMNDAMNAASASENMNMSMNINMNDQMNSSTESDNVSMSMNINLNDGFSDASNAANSNMNVNMNINDNSGMTENTSSDLNNMNTAVNETVTTTTVTTTTINEAPVETTSPVSSSGCANPVQDMSRIMGAIDEESFDDGKMMVAKQATSRSCLTVDQIKQIMEEFSFSKNRVEFAKYGYDRCYNPDDYYQVNSSFDFSSEKEELNDYIQSRRRD